MDYKKAYYSLIERLKDTKEDDALCDERYCCVIDGLIQESEESERIRKAISQCVEDMRGQFEKLYSVHHKDAIAWLEKHGTPAKLSEEEQNRFAKCVLSECASSFINYLDAHKYEGKMCVSNGECEDIENAFHNAMWDRLHRYYCKFIEKQGIKPQGKSALEAIHEQKADNANKVERKFKVGDYIVNDYCKGKVIELTTDAYLLDTEQGIPFSCEHNAHLWGIQDAKDGDVLFSPNHNKLWIYMDKEQYHAAINLNYANFVSFGADIVIPSDVQPATKEQCDTLFARMKEAGYEWDADKKELKKIEQKPYGLRQECIDCQFNYAGECKGYCAMKKDEKNSAWSEDDEDEFQIIQKIICDSDTSSTLAKRLSNWLQSIKQRATWKPTVNEKSNIKLVEPISITPKILQKNEFELKPNGWLWCQDKGNEEQNYIFIQFRKDLDEVRLVEISFVGKIQATFQQVQDVHELQNLLNVCRIKKKIEL